MFDALLTLAAAASVQVAQIPDEIRRASLPMHVEGRVDRVGADVVRQWPGTYFETAFRGRSALFRIGAGDVRLHVLVDGRPVQTLVKPTPGLYRVGELAPGRHVVRVEIVSESQAGPTRFGGFFAPKGTTAAPLAVRRRQIEFIGDSHTVGYGNTASKRECTQDEVWAATDTSKAFGPMLARRYNADYQINAISGRGVVRNYNGFQADKLPEAYPFTLFDRRTKAAVPSWHPQVVVIALGTNDFTTPLHAGERWATRQALHADYEATYRRLIGDLRARDPHSLIVLWATDMANGEIEEEVSKVATSLRAAGERISYVPVNKLSLSACHEHPSLADDTIIAGKLAAAIDTHTGTWP